jgi:plasmid stability protein
MGKRTLVVVPEDMHRRLKMYAAAHGTQVKAIVAEALKQHLAKLEKK